MVYHMTLTLGKRPQVVHYMLLHFIVYRHFAAYAPTYLHAYWSNRASSEEVRFMMCSI